MTFSDTTAVVITKGDQADHMARLEEQYARLGMPCIIVKSPDILTRYLTAERHVQTPWVFFQDDDVSLTDEQITKIVECRVSGKIVSNMFDAWIEAQGYFDLALIGLGGVCQVGLWRSAFDRWNAAYDGDRAYHRLLWDADFIFGILTPYERYDFDAEAAILMEVATDSTRLSMKPGQHERKFETIDMARKLRTVTGALMVKDGAEHVERAVRSVAPMISSLTVLDTGSTDATLDILRTVCDDLDLPLHIWHADFDGFANSRNVLLEQARGHGDYFLMFDADEEWVGQKKLPPLALDVFVVNYAGPIQYGHPRVVRSSFPCAFEGAVHAALTWTQDARGMTLPGLAINHHGDLTHGDAEARLRKDIALLTTDLDAGVDPPHTVFMRAKAYEGLQEWELARADYEARLEEQDEGSEEQFYSAWRLGCLLIEKFGEFDMGADHLYSAWMNRRGRIESIRDLSRYLDAVADATPFPETDMLFVHRGAYTTTPKEG